MKTMKDKIEMTNEHKVHTQAFQIQIGGGYEMNWDYRNGKVRVVELNFTGSDEELPTDPKYLRLIGDALIAVDEHIKQHKM